MLVKTAGVKHLVILINKMDDPTVNWDVKRYKIKTMMFNILTQKYSKYCFSLRVS
jgi:translation elongation factor EF-1alpha